MTPRDQSIGAGEVYGWEQPTHPFHVGQPLWIKKDILDGLQDKTCYFATGFTKAFFSEWFCLACIENDATYTSYSIPCSWLTDIMPDEVETPRQRRAMLHVIKGGRT
jgi:hypothetical protein